MTFPQKIVEAMPSDNEMVIGTVVSGTPLTVNVRGGNIKPGRLSTTGLSAGDPVALIREGETWLALGRMVSATTATGLGITSIQRSFQTPGVLGLTAVEQDVQGTQINFTTTSPAALVLAIWFADYEVIAAATAVGVTMLRVDATTNASPAATFRGNTTGERGTTGQADLVVVSPGAHTAILRANRAGGADGQLRLDPLHTTLLLAVIE